MVPPSISRVPSWISKSYGYEDVNACSAPVAVVEVPITSFPPFEMVKVGVLVAVALTVSEAPSSRTTQPSRVRSSERVIGVPSNS